MRQLTQEEKKALVVSLGMRRNYIETGDVILSASSAVKVGRQKEIKPLSIDQMKLITLSDELITKILQDELVIIK